MSGDVELVTLKTRVPREVANTLGALARAADRSLAAELRRAIDVHVTNATDDAAREDLQRRRDARNGGRS